MKRCFICYIVIFWNECTDISTSSFITLKLLVLCSMVPSTLFFINNGFFYCSRYPIEKRSTVNSINAPRGPEKSVQITKDRE
ncbi:hypothetical protein RhiirA4_190543 [Rhizophagus irregularis]|uniref:Uncharacterized protein n=1 Tax=Rhizophagus irregularis TaxID=588596 RepID=A0A2I1GIU2_9GLOM|nr:hypothetical protein RhiirA4_190543 [Rhizophagus irregularis]